MDDIRLEQIPTVPIMGRSIIAHDPMSLNFPAAGFLMTPGLPRIHKTWRRGPAYDQGRTSSCVGQTFRGILNTTPNTALVGLAIRAKYSGLSFYSGGQQFDEWPGVEPQYYGTSALGVCKYLLWADIIKEYRWCFGADEVIDTLCQHGPVAIGVRWSEQMMRTDADGYLTPGGRLVGGHEVELHGVEKDKKYVVGTNSWGTEWGISSGRFKMRWDVLDQLLSDDGDAVTVVEVVPR